MIRFYYFPLCIFLLLFFTENKLAYSQDIHFLQYNSSPQNLNPAQTGLFDGDWRLTGNYRSQWSSVANAPYTTFSFSGDTKLGNKLKGSMPAMGLLINSDKSGDSKLKSTQVYLSVSYIKKLTKDSTRFLSIGIQPGVTNKKFNPNAASFDEQFDGEKYNPGLSSGENFNLTNVSYFDVGAGAAYHWRKTERKKVNIGFSVLHMNKPIQTFLKDSSSKVSVKYNLSGIAEFPVTSKFGILPSFLIQRQGNLRETLLGLFAKYYLSPINQKNTSISLGAFLRTKDAYAVVVNMEYKNLNIGISYDVNYSKLSAATNNNGALEISLVYVFKKYAPPLLNQRIYPIYM